MGETTVKMFAYNGSMPGPTLRVQQGSEIIVNFTNESELETTIHWHGLRLTTALTAYLNTSITECNHLPMGGSFKYHLRFPDPGVYWYHPHIREDYTQELGLYGNIIVNPKDPHYWARQP